MHLLKIKLSAKKRFLTVANLDYTNNFFQIFILLLIFFFCMISKKTTKNRSRWESVQSSTVCVVYYLHRSLWKLTGKSKFSCFFLNSMLSKRINVMWAQQMAALNSLEDSLPVSKAQHFPKHYYHTSPPTKVLFSTHGRFCSAAYILHTLKWRHLWVWNSFRAEMVIKNKHSELNLNVKWNRS